MKDGLRSYLLQRPEVERGDAKLYASLPWFLYEGSVRDEMIMNEVVSPLASSISFLYPKWMFLLLFISRAIRYTSVDLLAIFDCYFLFHQPAPQAALNSSSDKPNKQQQPW